MKEKHSRGLTFLRKNRNWVGVIEKNGFYITKASNNFL